MSQQDPREYLEIHLFNDLLWLLCAATEWHVQQTVNPKDDIEGQHIKLYALDSATLHARALLEFFTSGRTVRNHLGMDLYGLQAITSELYSDNWKDPMNRYLMHANERPGGQQLTRFNGEGTKHLKRMPIDFGREVVRLWRTFIGRLRSKDDQLATLAQSKLAEAITRAAYVVTSPINESYDIGPITWEADE